MEKNLESKRKYLKSNFEKLCKSAEAVDTALALVKERVRDGSDDGDDLMKQAAVLLSARMNIDSVASSLSAAASELKKMADGNA